MTVERIETTDGIDLWCGDARRAWADVAIEHETGVHAIITSPPYLGLRDYDHPDQLGLEDDPDDYVADLVGILDRWGRDVLRTDGSMWLNLGDTYATRASSTSHPGARPQLTGNRRRGKHGGADRRGFNTATRPREKCLLGVPDRVAHALTHRGWILRNRVVWHKPNAMPTSATDRLQNATETLFHFVREPRYYYDLHAIAEPYVSAPQRRNGDGRDPANRPDGHAAQNGLHRARDGVGVDGATRGGANPGDMWSIPTVPFTGAHYAVFPPNLIRRPILATVPERCCSTCGAGWVRQVERTPMGKQPGPSHGAYGTNTTDGMSFTMTAPATARTVGWSAACDCEPTATVPGVVADPFAGAGTTAVMARRLGRRAALVELNRASCELIRDRTRQGVLL